MKIAGVERNWEVADLTDDNHVVVRNPDTGKLRVTEDRPSDFFGIAYLTRSERGVLREGCTAGGRDRETPKRRTL